MAGILTEREGDVLRKIVLFGGYTTAYILNIYLAKSLDWSRRVLHDLAEQKVIRQHTYRLPNGAVVYQITGKGLRCCEQGDLHMRRSHHQPQYVDRVLCKAHFMAQQLRNGVPESAIVATTQQRVAWLLEHGVADGYLPRKFNGKDYILQIEESIILAHPTNPLPIPEQGFVFIYFDKPESAAKAQLRTVYQRFNRLRESSHCPNFALIICAADQERSALYAKAANSERALFDTHVITTHVHYNVTSE